MPKSLGCFPCIGMVPTLADIRPNAGLTAIRLKVCKANIFADSFPNRRIQR